MIRNRDALISLGLADARRICIEVVEAGMAAIEPFAATVRVLRLDDDVLRVGNRSYELSGIDRILVLGAGKASLRVAEAIESVLGDRVDSGFVVVPKDQVRSLRRIEVFGADHPLPTARSVEGARRLLELAMEARHDDLVIACVTGGSSALASLPPAGVTIAEKRELHKLLLESGADITEINTVRKHVSLIKGGRLAEAAFPAQLANLTVSDVAGDRLEYITDLTVQNSTTVADALTVLHRYRLWERIAPSIRGHLETDEIARMPDLTGVDIHSVLVATGDSACEAMTVRARGLGVRPFVLSTELEGESREVGRVLASVAAECARRARPFEPPCVFLGCGGETTVTLQHGDRAFGLGGPNQEGVLAFALKIPAGSDIACIMLDTDGSDGGSEFAGGVVDTRTVERAAERGVDIASALASHRSTEALKLLQDLVTTGPTGTNANDMFAIVVAQQTTEGAQES